YSTQEAEGQSFRERYLRSQIDEQDWEVGGSMELEIRARNDTIIPTETILASWFAGNQRYRIAMLRDIRLRRLAEATQRRLNEALELRVQERTTELQSALSKLEQAHEFRNRVMESAAFGFSVLNEEGEFSMVNQHFADMTGYTMEQMIGQPYSMLLSAEKHAALLPYFHRVLRKRQPLRDFETEILRQDRSTTTLLLGWSPIVVNDEVVGVVATAIDISARKRAEAQVLVLNAELERRVRERTAQLETVVKELEAFSYSVSHDLRAPLRHINGHVQMLIEEFKSLPDAAQSRLRRIGISALQMGELIDDLLMFSQMGRAEVRHSLVDMRAMATEVIRELAEDVASRQIEWHVEDGLPPVHGDPAMLRQVWVNLLSNAIKYTRECELAHIEICGERTERGELCYWVKDNGAGFDMAYADKLFEVFQRLHDPERFEGTGIGLANVKRIVERHGGQVWAEATPNRGATFFFTLPDDSAERKAT
ncbi:MAG TPA: ATP-binding protein, partial [Burkholderiales bacterium]|nr:ATP-binding protein [Burkholderiales bacterium]